MILQQLYRDANVILGGRVPPPMYKPLEVRWLIPLTREGVLAGISLVRLGDNKRGEEWIVPYALRTSGPPKPFLIVDTAAYVLGVGEQSERPAEKHAAYRAQLDAYLRWGNDPVVSAIGKYLDHWDLGEERDLVPAELTSKDRIAFEVDGMRVHDSTGVQAYWAALNGEGTNEAQGQCLVCGVNGPIVSNLPGMLKGIPDGQTTGVALVSSNLPAFESYETKSGSASPISKNAAELFTKALNSLLSHPESRLRIGSLVYVFWTRDGPDDVIASYLSGGGKTPIFASDARKMVQSMRKGDKAAIASVDTDDFFALALSASGARAVVRDWLHTTLSSVQAALLDWLQTQEIVGPDGTPPRFFGIYQLAASLYRDASKETLIRAGQPLIRAALHGEPLPQYLLSLAVMRCRAEQRVTRARAALIKAALVLSQRNETSRKEHAITLSTLNPNSKSSAYHCGRLLAELDAVQRVALGRINTTLVDRYYGAASTTPAVVFGVLLSNANKAHLPKIRKSRPGVYEALQRRIEQILQPLENGFPRTLNLADQALFSLGFYHQRANDKAQAAEAKAAKERGAATAEQAELADVETDDSTNLRED